MSAMNVSSEAVFIEACILTMFWVNFLFSSIAVWRQSMMEISTLWSYWPWIRAFPSLWMEEALKSSPTCQNNLLWILTPHFM